MKAAATRPAASQPVGPTADAAPWRAASVVLAAAVIMLPVTGMSSAIVYQDTLKAFLASAAAVLALLALFWRLRSPATLRTHAIVVLPLLLAVYALGSIGWAHGYLAACEAIRWALFAAVLAVGVNAFTGENAARLAWSVHLGAVGAAGIAALQFLFAFGFFAQGEAHPAATFANRNFMAEYLVCALPFGGMLLARARRDDAVALLSASIGLVVLALMMAATRSALIALGLEAIAFALIVWRLRSVLPMTQWRPGTRVLAILVFAGVVGGLGSIPSADRSVLHEDRGATAIERTLNRSRSISMSDSSLGMRKVMWDATRKMIVANPVTGVGAGAWEYQLPRFQDQRESVEKDYYAHNEILQLVAEYGLAGVLVLLLLARYLLRATRHAWVAGPLSSDGIWRATALASVMAMLAVSMLGFPWHMPATLLLFALSLSILAGSDPHGRGRELSPGSIQWDPAWRGVALLASAGAMAGTLYVASVTAQVEVKLVRAYKLAQYISDYPDPRDELLQPQKAEVLRLTREAIALNPHYRRLTPAIADHLARWGDMREAIEIWTATLSSRPFIVGINTNVARAHLALKEPAEASAYLVRARRVAPDAPGVRSLEVALLMELGDKVRALAAARTALGQGILDEDLLINTFVLASCIGDSPTAAQALAKLGRENPGRLSQALVQLATGYAQTGSDDGLAADAFRRALASATGASRAAVLAAVPARLRSRLSL
ncbi:O-antigen ligase family protein [Ramlibacter sp. AN1133]|uniref:O-antigen ligase family protein n=1 Tax=Ramlibacter sp. AN1133 TaxID=3133429 RepID=UPI0030C4764D